MSTIGLAITLGVLTYRMNTLDKYENISESTKMTFAALWLITLIAIWLTAIAEVLT